MSEDTKNWRLSASEKRVLASVLDEIIPPRDDGELPGAGGLGVGDHIEAALRHAPDLRSMIVQGLADLDQLARGKKAPGFAALSREDKLELLNQQGFVFPLTLHTCAGYYQNSRVVEALGLESRPPHPQGYAMEPNDLSLLDPVRRRPSLYRRV